MAYTTIDDPTDYFNTVLYTGTGSSNAITGVGHSPDFVWTKRRNDSGVHFLQNTVTGTNKALFSDQTGAEFTGGVDGGTSVTSFDSDGFTVGTEGAINGSSDTFVSWNWKAGTAFSNSAGANGATLASSGSKNDTAGFSIVSYTGDESGNDTVFHGLSQTPELIITKSRASADNWGFFHSSFSSQEYMFFNTTSAKADASSVWNALPGSTVFTVGDNAAVNDNGAMIAYCFHSVKGYSKFGVYTGNNNSNGNFIYTGFKPAWILSKDSASGQEWHLIDNKRDTFNDDDNAHLSPNRNHSEATVKSNRGTMKTDLLSNGFKLNTDGSHTNGTGTHIFLAFAESPFVNSNGIPTTAR